MKEAARENKKEIQIFHEEEEIQRYNQAKDQAMIRSARKNEKIFGVKKKQHNYEDNYPRGNFSVGQSAKKTLMRTLFISVIKHPRRRHMRSGTII